MTPFDPLALVAMLRAFYPIVGRAALARARAERPEYFAGGELIGTSKTHLQLPDGRIFDLILNEGGAQDKTGWQALEDTGDAPDVDDPFALEDGPLVPLDESEEWFPWRGLEPLETLLGDPVVAIAGAEAQLDRAEAAITEFDGAAQLESRTRAALDGARDAHADVTRAINTEDPGELVRTSDGHLAAVEQARGDYDYELPEYIAEPVPTEKPEPPDHRPPKNPDPGGG